MRVVLHLLLPLLLLLLLLLCLAGLEDAVPILTKVLLATDLFLLRCLGKEEADICDVCRVVCGSRRGCENDALLLVLLVLLR